MTNLSDHIRYRRKSIVILLLLTSTSILFLICEPLETLTKESQEDTSLTRLLVRPEEDTVLLEPLPPICKRSHLNLVIGVFTAPTNWKARSAVRRTWARRFQEYGAMIFFLMGRGENSTVQESVKMEAGEYNDIVVESFQDTYNNLTLKTIFLLKFLSSRCPSAKFIMKVDDDVFINPEKILATLQRTKLHSAKLSDHYIRYALIGKKMVNIRPIREEFYPPYLQGLTYVFTGSLLQSLYSCTLRTPFLPFEDVFLTGLCATQHLQLYLTHNSEFHSVALTFTLEWKLKILSDSSTLHRFSPEDMEKAWNIIEKKRPVT